MNSTVDTLLYGLVFRKLIEKKMEPLSEQYGLQKIDLLILHYLNHSGKHDTSSDMLHLNMFTKGHISQSLTRLEEKGYIITKHDESDHRTIHNYVRDDAFPLLKEIEKRHKQIYEIILKDISNEDKKVLLKIAKQVNANITEELEKRID